MQFLAQDRHYRAAYPSAAFSLIFLGAAAAGRLYVDRQPHEICLVEVTLLPEHRGQGLGTALVAGLQREAEGHGQRVALHVSRGNPALRLYERLGFVAAGGDDVYLRLEWRPASGSSGVRTGGG